MPPKLHWEGQCPPEPHWEGVRQQRHHYPPPPTFSKCPPDKMGLGTSVQGAGDCHRHFPFSCLLVVLCDFWSHSCLQSPGEAPNSQTLLSPPKGRWSQYSQGSLKATSKKRFVLLLLLLEKWQVLLFNVLFKVDFF